MGSRHRCAALCKHVLLSRHKSSLLHPHEEELLKKFIGDSIPGKHPGATSSVLLTNSTDPATQIQNELFQLKKLAIEHHPTTNTIHTEERRGFVMAQLTHQGTEVNCDIGCLIV